MTFNEFINKYQDTFVEVAGSANAKNQCVDLANRYFLDVWKVPIIEWTNAVDFPERISAPLTFIPNTKEYIPNPGEVAVFKKYGSLYGSPGHIGVVVTATQNSLDIFEQNWPTGSQCKVNRHNYLGCRGFIKNQSPPGKDHMETKNIEGLGEVTFDKLAEEYVKEHQRVMDARKERDEFKTAYENELTNNENLTNKLALTQTSCQTLITDQTNAKNAFFDDVKQLTGSTANNYQAVLDLMENLSPKDLSDFPDNEVFSEAISRIINKLRRSK